MHTFHSLMVLPHFILLLVIFGMDSGTIARYLSNSTTVLPRAPTENGADEDERVDIVGDILVDEFPLTQPAGPSEEERKISAIRRVLQKVLPGIQYFGAS
ncbi:hypothetical protein Aduo_007649 [Ancylostoma duodenale]